MFSKETRNFIFADYDIEIYIHPHFIGWREVMYSENLHYISFFTCDYR